MLVGQTEGIALFPETSEDAWALMATLMLIMIATSIIGLIVWAKRAAKGRAQLEARVTDLEQEHFDKPAS